MAERRDLIATVRDWFCGEWPGWYGPDGPGDVECDLEAFAASPCTLPVGLLVLSHARPIGAAVLKAESIASHKHLGPWAAAGYVMPAFRGQGAGAFLLRALVGKAGELGWPNIYCGTSTANRLLERSGWKLIELTDVDGKPLAIYRTSP